MDWIIIADVCFEIYCWCDPVQFRSVAAGSLQGNKQYKQNLT